MHKLRVGYPCNIRDKWKADDERYNEGEPPETVEAVTAALVDAGCEVSIIDVGPDIFHVLERNRSGLDLVFNNAEGLEEGELREAIRCGPSRWSGPIGKFSRRCHSTTASFRRQPVSHSGLGEQIPGVRRVCLDLPPEVRHVDTQVVHLLRK
jgi:hypothetical protein